MTRFAIAIAWVVACTGGTLGPSADGDRDGRFGQPEDGIGEAPVPRCPQDPDCGLGNDECDECPDYWVCEDLADDRKRCINPGPDHPDDGGGGDWNCEQLGEFVECRRRGGDVPDDGGGGDWDCRQEGEFVVCTDDTPSYPPGGGGGMWTCWYQDEFRICENTPPPDGGGDGGDWACFDLPIIGRQCIDNDPDYPDDEDWDCWYEAGELFCRRPDDGDFPPGGGGDDWDCEDQGEFIVCNDDTPDYPPGGGGDEWDCDDLGEFRICEGDVPPGGGDDPPDGPPPFDPPGDDECEPGSQRWCDDDVYCSWGKQDCLPDGTWGRCIEPRVTSSGLTDRPDTECGCRYFYFNEDCCEDQADRDLDGHADCLIPSGHTAPACPSDGSLCSYCDVHADCADDGICLFRRDGYAFCGSGCAGTSCPGGYSCRRVNLRTGSTDQCIPDTDSCD